MDRVQTKTKEVSADVLESFGKYAAASWLKGEAKDLSEAVVDTVKKASLSPEQVKRVVEFANTAAFLDVFRKEGSANRVVNFQGGPADPSSVLATLNSIDSLSQPLPSSGGYDYAAPPRTKTAAARSQEESDLIKQAFASNSQPEERSLGSADPFTNLANLKDNFKLAYDTSTSKLSSLEVMYEGMRRELLDTVKEAALHGHSLSEVLSIWGDVAPTEEHIKVAMTSIMPDLVDGVAFKNDLEVGESITKVAFYRGAPDPTHPMVVRFNDYCEVLDSLVDTREEQRKLAMALPRIDEAIKLALSAPKEGLIPMAVKGVKSIADLGGKAGHGMGEVLMGEGSGAAKHMGTAGKLLAGGATVAAPLLMANKAHQLVMADPHVQAAMPYVRGAQDTAMSFLPGTNQYYANNPNYQMAAMDGGMY